MKKVITICLALIITLLSFAGCSKGGEKPESETKAESTTQAVATKDELIAKAVEADANDINNESFENLVATKYKYCNKALKLKGIVVQINEDNILLAGAYGLRYRIAAYLPIEDMINLKTGQQIVVVGETSDEIVDDVFSDAEYTVEYHDFQMPNAYLFQDTFEFTGKLKGANIKEAPAYNIQIGKTNYTHLIYFADGVDTSSFSLGQEIKFKAKCFCGNNKWSYYDAEIIE